jgi:hypothetical protein
VQVTLKHSSCEEEIEVFGFYFGSPHWNNQREFYDWTFSLGSRVSR